MRVEQIRQRLQALGARPCHEQRVLRSWTQLRSLDTRHRLAENFLPLALRNALPEIMSDLAGLANIRSQHAGEDASLETGLMLERKAFQLLFASRDQKEGMHALLEKRDPQFTGE